MKQPRRSGRHALGAGAAYLLLTLPPVRHWLEASMASHMLVQMPLLVALGMVAVRLLPAGRRRRLRNGFGGPLACLTAATFASAYWMLPRALDAAIGEPLAEFAKFVSLPLLVGLPLALAWESFGLIGRGFVWTNLISMQVFLGWLYVAAPLRVCNNYLVDDQLRVGWLLITLAGLLFAGWLGALFRGAPASRTEAPMYKTA
ncbi:MAG: hypothetical protein HYU78_13000 [Rhodocyclales bacterium]|nr:hypothetical protein [Rhodocyclales bacterium]